MIVFEYDVVLNALKKELGVTERALEKSKENTKKCMDYGQTALKISNDMVSLLNSGIYGKQFIRKLERIKERDFENNKYRNLSLTKLMDKEWIDEQKYQIMLSVVSSYKLKKRIGI